MLYLRPIACGQTAAGPVIAAGTAGLDAIEILFAALLVAQDVPAVTDIDPCTKLAPKFTDMAFVPLPACDNSGGRHFPCVDCGTRNERTRIVLSRTSTNSRYRPGYAGRHIGITGQLNRLRGTGAIALEAVTLRVPDANPDRKDSSICSVPWPDFILVLAGTTQLYTVAFGTEAIVYFDWSTIRLFSHL